MKTKHFFLLLATLIFQIGYAQMDDKFYFPSKILKPIENLKYEEFSIKTNQDTITGIFLPSKNPKATILFFHGAGGNVNSYVPMVKPLIEDGFQVVMVDFQGYGKSSGKPTHTNIAEDGQRFFDYAVNRKDVKNTKILIYGASMGTQIAAHLAKNNKDRITGLILDGSISSFNDIAGHYVPDMKHVIARVKFASYSAKEDVKELHSLPKLFIHSEEDKDVPYSQGLQVYDNAPEPKQFLKYQGAHLDATTVAKKEVLQAINQLLKPLIK